MTPSLLSRWRRAYAICSHSALGLLLFVAPRGWSKPTRTAKANPTGRPDMPEGMALLRAVQRVGSVGTRAGGAAPADGGLMRFVRDLLYVCRSLVETGCTWTVSLWDMVRFDDASIRCCVRRVHLTTAASLSPLLPRVAASTVGRRDPPALYSRVGRRRRALSHLCQDALSFGRRLARPHLAADLIAAAAESPEVPGRRSVVSCPRLILVLLIPPLPVIHFVFISFLLHPLPRVVFIIASFCALLSVLPPASLI